MTLQEIKDFIIPRLEATDAFFVDASISPANDIIVEIDSPTGVDIDFCTSLARDFEVAFPREPEDYSLEIGSAGLTAPFKVRGQWEKNLGNDIEVLTTDGRKLYGTLQALGDDNFTLRSRRKVKHEGQKRPSIEDVDEVIPLSAVKSARYDLKF